MGRGERSVSEVREIAHLHVKVPFVISVNFIFYDAITIAHNSKLPLYLLLLASDTLN